MMVRKKWICSWEILPNNRREAIIGCVAELYLRKFASTSGTDKTFGLRDNNGKLYIGDKDTKIKESSTTVVDKEYDYGSLCGNNSR